MKLRCLSPSTSRGSGERIDGHTLFFLGDRRSFVLGEPRRPVARGSQHNVDISELLAEAARSIEGQRFGLPFLLSEWTEIVDAWQITDREAYRQVPRLGRKTRIGEAQRDLIWPVFERLHKDLTERGLQTQAEFFTNLARRLAESSSPMVDFIVADEAQDLSVAQLRFLVALGKHRPDSLFFTGDLGQRIFQQPFSWRSLGVDLRGRSRTLHVNYRTSQQIRSQADRLLGPELSDVDGIIRETLPDDIRAQRAASPAPDIQG